MDTVILTNAAGSLRHGEGWTGGYTGTLRDRGLPVQHEANLLRGDLVHYGPGPACT